MFEHARFTIKEKFNENEQALYRGYRKNFNAVFDGMIEYIKSLPPEQSGPCLNLIQALNEKFRNADYRSEEFDMALVKFKKEFFKIVEPNVRNYAMGAMTGFFKKLNLRAELGLESGQWINRRDAANLSLVTQDIAEEAKTFRR